MMRPHVRIFLAELLGTCVFLSLGSLGPSPASITWGASLTLSSVMAGPKAHLNPALSLGMVAGQQASLSSLPARVLGQFTGAFLSALALFHTSSDLISSTNSSSPFSPILTPPPPSPQVYSNILTFTLGALLFSLLYCGSRGTPVYQGLSLSMVIHIVGDTVGPGLNPAREVASRIVLLIFSQEWKAFLESDGWVWIPVTWTFSGCLMGSLIFWIFIEIPKQLESSSSKLLSLPSPDLEKGKSVCPAPPPPPPLKHWPSEVFPPRNVKDEKRASQVSRHLERYRSVSLDKKDSKSDSDDKVVVNVGGASE